MVLLTSLKKLINNLQSWDCCEFVLVTAVKAKNRDHAIFQLHMAAVSDKKMFVYSWVLPGMVD